MMTKKSVTVWHEAPGLVTGEAMPPTADVEIRPIPVSPISKRAHATVLVAGSCGDCIFCESTCPNLRHDKELKAILIHSVGCRGCGQCISSCPSGSLQQRNSYLGRIDKDISDRLGEGPKGVPTSCNNCPVVSGDLPQGEVGGNNIRLSCSGRFEPVHLFDALSKGFDGMIVVGCLFKGFPYERNRTAMEERLKVAGRLMELLGIDERRLVSIDEHFTEGGMTRCIRQLTEA